MRAALQGSHLEHVQLEGGHFHGAVAQVSTDQLRVDWGAYSLAVLCQGQLSADRLSLGLLISGTGAWRVRGQQARNGDLLLLPEGGELTISLPSQSQWLAVQVPRARLEALGMKLEGLHTDGGWAGAAQHPGLQRAAAELASALLTQPGTAPQAGDLTHIHEDLFAALAAAWATGPACRQAGAEPLCSNERWRVVRRAESYLASRTEPTVRIDDVCLAAGTSLSRLERAFREVYGHSPRRTLTLRRMAAVRRELLAGHPGTSVTEAATRWGFFHLGRFAQDYAALYQERPSTTLQRSQLRH
ncbi:MAG: hypothetical protein C4K60_00230 [Ideonella sp. MAG2]|nr:MAG: hypothetical protein C4K60_00230 [Ideonella sp. MAG2]